MSIKPKSSIITYHVYLNLDSVGLGHAKFVGNSNPNDFSQKNGTNSEGGEDFGSLQKIITLRNIFSVTLVFQLKDTVRLFGTLLLLDPIHFPKSEP